LGQLRYLSLLAHADAVIGNSSSALLEAPAFHLPVVNVGLRQQGRLTPGNVLSTSADRVEIVRALRRALDPEFRTQLESMENPYGDGHVSERVTTALLAAPPAAQLRAKRFFDVEGSWRKAVELGDG
jgi:UDP-N-acetylglucosamine 2-epimerase